MTEIPDLQPLFLPESVAVYGASTRDPSRLGNRLLRNVMGSALDDVQAISPTPGTAEGLPTVRALVSPADLALISVPAASVEAAMTDAADGGARAAIVLTSGFGETGGEGQAAQTRLRAIATRAAMRFLGPNCMGVISRLGDGGWMNGSYFWDVDLVPGGVPERRTTSLAEAAVAVSELRAPLVAKASGVAHKSELGLVRLGLSPEEVLDTWQELADAGDGTVLVAEFIQGELELVVGGLRDPHFGPAVTLGLGGVAAEVFNDTVTVLAPPDPGEVESALKALRGAPLLHGYRGTEPMDFHTLGMIVRTVADALTDHDDIIEIDCNPVVITRGKPVVVDALVVVCN